LEWVQWRAEVGSTERAYLLVPQFALRNSLLEVVAGSLEQSPHTGRKAVLKPNRRLGLWLLRFFFSTIIIHTISISVLVVFTATTLPLFEFLP
jgi:hypothetical protein